jgi:hypothetical protein
MYEPFCFWQVDLLRRRNGQTEERRICCKKGLLETCPFEITDFEFLENEDLGNLYRYNEECPDFIFQRRIPSYK